MDASEKFTHRETTPIGWVPMLVLMGRTKDPPRIPQRCFFLEWGKVTGVRQRDVVKATELSKSFVSMLWSGKKQPSVENLWDIALVFQVPAGLLLQHPNSPEARAMRAVSRINNTTQRDTAVAMLEGLAERR